MLKQYRKESKEKFEMMLKELIANAQNQKKEKRNITKQFKYCWKAVLAGYDYLVSTTNNSVVRGNKNKLNDYTYRLSFLVSKDSKMLTNCPNCNAKLKGRGVTVKCEYCGSTINRKSSTMVLERKEMVEQR